MTPEIVTIQPRKVSTSYSTSTPTPTTTSTSEPKFLYSNTSNGEILPGFFVYDRTAALTEDGHPEEAILYPVLSHQTTTIASMQCDLIGAFILLVNKLEQEICCSLPATVNFSNNVEFVMMHIGKYTLALSYSYPFTSEMARAKLQCIYTTFVAFYGGFKTALVHTTKELDNVNVDKESASYWKEVINLVHLPGDRQPSLIPVRQGGENLSFNERITRQLTILLESLYSYDTVLGALTVYNNRPLLSFNLTKSFIESMLCLISESKENFGQQISFDVNNVYAYRCFVGDDLVLIENTEGVDSYYTLLHLEAGLSLTLVVKLPENGDSLYDCWRHTCVRLKDELLKLHSEYAWDKSDQFMGRSVTEAVLKTL